MQADSWASMVVHLLALECQVNGCKSSLAAQMVFAEVEFCRVK